MNRLIRYAQHASAFLLEYVMCRGQESELALLQHMVTSGGRDDGGRSFWAGLMNFLKNHVVRVNTNPLVKLLSQIPAHTKYYFQSDSISLSSDLIKQAAIRLAQNARGQFLGKLPLLLASVLDNYQDKESTETLLDKIIQSPDLEFLTNLSLPTYEAFKAKLASVATISPPRLATNPQDATRESSTLPTPHVSSRLRQKTRVDYSEVEVHGDRGDDDGDDEDLQTFDPCLENVVVKWFVINLMLPKPWQDIPRSPISDSFIHFTEAALLNQLDANLLEDGTKIPKVGKTNKNTWLSAKNGLAQPQGHFIELLFGSNLKTKLKYRVADQGTDEKLVLTNSLETRRNTNGHPRVDCMARLQLFTQI